MKQSNIDRIVSYIETLTGNKPVELSKENNLVSFEMKTSQTALSVFPYDDDGEPYYTIVSTEIDGDERGIYSEVLLFYHAPDKDGPGHLIEGIYTRPIEYKNEPDAEFTGTILLVDDPDAWSTAFKQAEERYHRRASRETLHFIRNEMINLGRMLPLMGEGEDAQKIREDFREMIGQSLRKAMEVAT